MTVRILRMSGKASTFCYVKVVLHRSHGWFFGVKVKTVKLVGGRRLLAVRSGLMVWMTLRLPCMPPQIIQMIAFAQIMDIWRPGRSMEDHLKTILPSRSSNFLVNFCINSITSCFSMPSALANQTQVKFCLDLSSCHSPRQTSTCQTHGQLQRKIFWVSSWKQTWQRLTTRQNNSLTSKSMTAVYQRCSAPSLVKLPRRHLQQRILGKALRKTWERSPPEEANGHEMMYASCLLKLSTQWAGWPEGNTIKSTQ